MKKKLTSNNIFSLANIFKVLSATLVLFVLSFSSCESTSETEEDLGPIDRVTKPIANFSYSTPEINEPFKVSFANASSDAISYAWDFGDGNNSSEENPVHTYAKAGIYDVMLTATDSLDQSSEKTISITLMELMLIADFTYTVSEENLLEVSFNNISENAESYAWDFGDETTSTEMNPVHEYAQSGVYTVVLTATSSSDEVETKTMDIEVSDGVVAEIRYPGFEGDDTDAIYAAWNESPNLVTKKISFSSSPVFEGDRAAKLEPNKGHAAYQKIEVKPNKKYAITFHYTLKADGTEGGLTCTILDGHIEDPNLIEGATIATQEYTNQDSSNEYIQETVTFTTTENNYIGLYFTNTGNVDARFDQVSIQEID